MAALRDKAARRSFRILPLIVAPDANAARPWCLGTAPLRSRLSRRASIHHQSCKLSRDREGAVRSRSFAGSASPAPILHTFFTVASQRAGFDTVSKLACGAGRVER